MGLALCHLPGELPGKRKGQFGGFALPVLAGPDKPSSDVMIEPQAGAIAFGESDRGGVLGHGLVEALTLFAGGLDEFEDDGFLGHVWPLPKALAAIAAASFGGSPAWPAAAIESAIASACPRIRSATISASRQAPQ
jgi:hypothetical protein